MKFIDRYEIYCFWRKHWSGLYGEKKELKLIKLLVKRAIYTNTSGRHHYLFARLAVVVLITFFCLVCYSNLVCSFENLTEFELYNRDDWIRLQDRFNGMRYGEWVGATGAMHDCMKSIYHPNPIISHIKKARDSRKVAFQWHIRMVKNQHTNKCIWILS